MILISQLVFFFNVCVCGIHVYACVYVCLYGFAHESVHAYTHVRECLSLLFYTSSFETRSFSNHGAPQFRDWLTTKSQQLPISTAPVLVCSTGMCYGT